MEDQNKTLEENEKKQDEKDVSLNESFNNSFNSQLNTEVQQKKKSSPQVAELQKKLKSKDKEVNKLDKKLKKLQEAFKSKSLFGKKLQKDRETLLTFIEIAMKYKNKQDFRKNQIGQYSLDELLTHIQIQDPQTSFTQQNQEAKEQKPEVQIENLSNQIESQKSKNQALVKKCQVQEQEIANLKAENILKVFKSTAKQDPEQQLEMHKKISWQSTEILKLKQKLSDAKNKITDLECSLELASQDKQEVSQKQDQQVKSKQKMHFEQSQPFFQSNPYLQNGKDSKQLQEEKQQLLKKNSSLESSLNSTVEELNNLKIKVAQLTQLQGGQSVKRHQINYKAENDEKVFFDLDDNIPKIRKLQEKIRDLESVIQLQMQNERTLSSRVKQFKNIEGPQSTNILYLKNIILKYMEYLSQKNLKQAETLEYVIFTVLKCDGKDLKKLSKLREKTGLFKFFQSKGMAPPDQVRAIKYTSQSSFQRNEENLSQSMIHTTRQEYRSSLGDLNKSMHGYLNTERTMKNDQNIFNS